jgi:uncharacterized protein (DUF1800 family)
MNMLPTQHQLWAPYVPDEQSPWDLRRVVHLHRRAGFAATWGELQRDLRDGPRASVDRLLGETTGMHVPAGFQATAGVLASSAADSAEIRRLRGSWFYRIVFGPDPLRERLTLFWHNHFATGYAKVQDVVDMWRQNELFRRLGLGSFAELLNAAVRDPALMVYLDAQTNRRGHPNQNLARELMELFTLGIGNYTEQDVRESARALTGWTVADGRFAEAPDAHDPEEKTILGRRGRWTGSDLVRMLLEHPATAVRLATKLCGVFFGEPAVPADAVRSLAEGLRQRRLGVGWAVETILRSSRFFAAANLGNRILSPVEFVAGATRILELFEPATNTLSLADWSARMGQDLFDPPNVGGWAGGRDWISPRTMIVRSNFVVALLGGIDAGRPRPYDPTALARRHGEGTDAGSVFAFHHRLRFGTEPTPEGLRRVRGLPVRQAIAVLLTSPEAQLG